jgi:hypothetical protein
VKLVPSVSFVALHPLSPVHTKNLTMKTGSILALASLAAAADYADFEVHHLEANMPNGYKFGYYYVDFNVTSQAGATPSTSWCYK